MGSLTVLIGPPGCGKSTWARAHGCGTVLSSDAVRAELFGDVQAHVGDAETAAELDRRVLAAVAANADVVVENGDNPRRDGYLEAARAAEVPAHAVVFDNGDEARRRNAGREHGSADPPMPPAEFERALAAARSASVAVAHEAWDTVQWLRSYRLP